MSLYKCRHSEGQLSPFHVFLQVHFFRPRIPFRIEERRLLSRRELGKWVYTRLKFFRQYSTVIIFTGRFVSIRSLPLNHPSNLTRLTLPNLQRSLTFSKATEKEFLLFRGEKSNFKFSNMADRFFDNPDALLVTTPHALFLFSARRKMLFTICRPECPYWEKLCPRYKTSTNTDRPRPANNVFIVFFLWKITLWEIFALIFQWSSFTPCACVDGVVKKTRVVYRSI